MVLVGRLYDTVAARAIVASLPYSSEASIWGDEVYFSLPATGMSLEDDASDVVKPGTICYWVQGSSLTLPYGPTPVSVEEECRLVTAVNRVGELEGDPRRLAQIAAGDMVTVSLIGADAG
ncbi:MAG: hypothetical protein AMXMBFR82_44440 [Candidatus Hydrogenedentota bacterium]